MLPIGITRDGGMQGQGWKVPKKKQMEINIFQLENKKKKWLGKDKRGSTFKRIYYMATFKGMWHKHSKAKID